MSTEIRPVNWDQVDRMTNDIFEDPQPGDVCSEMYSVWLFVIDRWADDLIVVEGPGTGASVRQSGQPRRTTVDELRKTYSYRHGKGFWVSAVMRGANVDWAKDIQEATI